MFHMPPLVGLLQGAGCPSVENVTPPTLSVVPNDYPGSVAVVTSTGTWTGSPSTFVYTWKRNGSVIPGEVANAYTLLPTDVGATITAFVTASSGCASSPETATNPAGVTVLCEPVTNTVPPVLSGGTSVAPGAVLTISTNGSWAGSPSTYTYKWKRNGVTIGGEVANTYTTLVGDIGKTITAFVTAHSVCASSAETATNPTGAIVTPTAATYGHWDASTIVQADNTPLAQWNDLSGNGAHLTPAGGAPTFRTGPNRVTSFPSQLQGAVGGLPVVSAMTVFMVAYLPNTSSPDAGIGMFQAYSTGGADQRTITIGSDGLAVNRIGAYSGGVSVVNSGPGYTPGALHLIAFRYNSVMSRFLMDSQAGIATVVNAAMITNTLLVCPNPVTVNDGTANFTEYISEVLAYASALSDAQMDSVATHLKTKWGIP